MNDLKKTVGANLKAICKIKGVKNYQVAEYMGVTASSVSHWFKGDNFLDMDNLVRLCQYLGVSLDQVFGLAPIFGTVLSAEENSVIIAYRAAGAETKANIRSILHVPDLKKDTSSKAE